MKDDSKNNNMPSYRSISSYDKNRDMDLDSIKRLINKNLSNKIPYLKQKNEKRLHKNADIIFLNNNLGININTFQDEKEEEKVKKKSIGINTSKYYLESKKIKNQKMLIIKPKVNTTKPYSNLFKKYIISYEQIKKDKINQESLKGKTIPKLKMKKKFNTISVLSSKKVNKNINKRNIPLKRNKKESLLTYNFNKDAYSNEQRLLLSISNNNFDTMEKIKFHNRLKKAKTNKIFKTMIYSNEDFKSMSNKTSKIKKYKLFNKTNLFHEDPTQNNQIEHSITKDIKNSFCNSLLKDIFSHENKNIKPEDKLLRKKEILKLMEYPDSVFNYILQELKEYNILKNKRSGYRNKLENMKNDLKLTEQRALYELINLKYERVPGEEINIKTNLFCSKNKHNMNF